jgi:hypothetical protein
MSGYTVFSRKASAGAYNWHKKDFGSIFYFANENGIISTVKTAVRFSSTIGG